MMKLTKQAALAIQARQVAHYAALYPEIDVVAIVKGRTFAECLKDDIEYHIAEINLHIPRGGAIEMAIGKYNHHYD